MANHQCGQSSTSMASLPMLARPLARLRRRTYSLCRARFFTASLAASPPALARPVFTPPKDLRAPTLERTRGAGASADGPAGCASRCFAMTRVREMRGFFAMRPLDLGGTAVGMRDGLASAVAAAASDVWYVGFFGDSGLERVSAVSGCEKILKFVCRGDCGERGLLVSAWRVAFVAATDFLEARFAGCSATAGRADGLPTPESGFPTILARELAVGESRDDVRARDGGG